MGMLEIVGAGKKYRERRVGELRRNPLSVKEQPQRAGREWEGKEVQQGWSYWINGVIGINDSSSSTLTGLFLRALPRPSCG